MTSVAEASQRPMVPKRNGRSKQKGWSTVRKPRGSSHFAEHLPLCGLKDSKTVRMPAISTPGSATHSASVQFAINGPLQAVHLLVETSSLMLTSSPQFLHTALVAEGSPYK